MNYKTLITILSIISSSLVALQTIEAQASEANNGLLKIEYINPIYLNNGHVNNIAHGNWSGYRITPSVQIKNFEAGMYFSFSAARITDKSYIFRNKSAMPNIGILAAYNFNLSSKFDLKPTIGVGTGDIRNQAKTGFSQYHGGLSLVYSLCPNIQLLTSLQYQNETYTVKSNERLLVAFERAQAFTPSIGIQFSTGK